MNLDPWLAERLAGAPESLRERVVAALGEEGRGKGEADVGALLPASPSPLPAHLRSVAEQLVAQANSTPPSRDSALTLLAADALITLAVEAEAVSEF